MSEETNAPISTHTSEDGSIGKTVAGLNDLYFKTVDNFMTRMGAPDPSAPVPADVASAVQEIVATGLEGGGPPSDARVSDIVWGWHTQGLVDRQKAVYYRLSISESQAESGCVLLCRSKNKSKLRVFVYDKTGLLVDKADAYRSRDQTSSQAVMVFSGADTLRMEAQMEVSTLASWSKTPHSVFAKLNGLVPNPVKLLSPGPYLIAVYIDNALLQGPFSLVALPSKSCEEQAAVLHVETSIAQAKERLAALEGEYTKAKNAYETALGRMRDEEDLTEALMDSRESVYRQYFSACGSAYSVHEGLEADETDKVDKPAPIDASKMLRAATERASLASGWLSSRFATGLVQFQKAASSFQNENASVASSLEGQHAGTVQDEEEEEEEEEPSASSAPVSMPPPAEKSVDNKAGYVVESAENTTSVVADKTREEDVEDTSGIAQKTSVLDVDDVDDMFDEIVGGGGARKPSSVEEEEQEREV